MRRRRHNKGSIGTCRAPGHSPYLGVARVEVDDIGVVLHRLEIVAEELQCLAALKEIACVVGHAIERLFQPRNRLLKPPQTRVRDTRAVVAEVKSGACKGGMGAGRVTQAHKIGKQVWAEGDTY